jgi:hypothetical protein
MSTEQPKKTEERVSLATEVESGAVELSEDEQQTAQENRCRERFIQDWVMTSMELTPEQKVFAANVITSKPGAWREYNGKDFKVVDAYVEANVWKVSFGLYFDDYEAQRVDVDIPLSE